MGDKNQRKAAIAEIIARHQIHTQEEMMEALTKKGIAVTQATLSRDIKELGAVKAPVGSAGNCYTIPKSQETGHRIDVDKMEMSGQLCVVHSQPGFASAVASLIDKTGIPGVMGTIAGDDTVLLMLKEDCDRHLVQKELHLLFHIV